MSQSQKPTVLVSGATGNVGTAAVKALAAKYGEHVKILAGVRDEQKATKTFEGIKNIEFIKFDTDQPETVDKALLNINAFFLIPPNPNNLGDGYNRQKTTFALIEAAKKNRVNFVLMIDLLVSGDHKFVFGIEFEEYFKALQATGIPHARLVAPNFCENLWGNVVTLQSDSAFYLPLPADAAWNYVAVEDLGVAAAAILSDSTKHGGKIYTITGPSLITNNDIAIELSKLTGRTITAYRGSHQQYSEIMIKIVGFPKWEVDGILQLWDMYTSGTGKARLITNDFYTVTGLQPTDMKEWIKRLVPAIQQ